MKNQDIVLENKNESVRVCIRCRPISKTETTQGHTCVVECTEAGAIFVTKPFVQEAPKQFTFDACYDIRATQE